MGENVVVGNTAESKLTKILGTLGNKDAVKILWFAMRGFDSTTDAHKKLGMSVKRYYYRLEKLMESDLIIKTNNRYELTPLGMIVADSTKRNYWAIENTEHLGIIEALRKSKTIDEGIWESVLATLFGNKSAEGKFGTSARIITTYEDLVDSIVRLMETAIESIYLATRYLDVRAMEAAWRSLARGVNIRTIDSTQSVLSSMKIVQMLIRHPKYVKIVYDLWHSEKAQVRYREAPFSFMVVDEKDCCFEVVNPAMKDFFVAIELHDSKTICPKLLETFQNLWKTSEKNDMFAEITKTLSEEKEND